MAARRTCPPRRCRRATPARASPRTCEWEKQLHEARLVGGLVAGRVRRPGRVRSGEWLIFEEEYYRAGGAAARHAERDLPARARRCSSSAPRSSATACCRGWPPREDLWCQGWSEPGAGSDLAALTSRAVRDDGRGGWRARPARRRGPPAARSARTCSACSAPTRTPARHRGLTYFLVPLDAPGVTVRGFSRLDGDEGFADVFFDDVFVPDDAVLGGVERRLAGRDGHHRLASAG